MDLRKLLILFLSVPFVFSLLDAADKPKLTLDEFFNSVGFSTVKISPDGQSVVIATWRADWNQNIFRKDLWLYRDGGGGGGGLVPLTQSGHDTEPEWSPDGRWIAFLSDRKAPSGGKESEEDNSSDKDKEDTNQLYVISPSGGEAFAVTGGEEEVHAFAWSSDARVLYFATRAPWKQGQKDEYKKQWKDVSQYRAAERGDVIFRLNLADELARQANAGTREMPDREKESEATPGSRPMANSPWRVKQISVSPDGNQLAFVTESVSERQEKVDEFEIYSIDLARASEERPARRLTENEAVENDLNWAPDNRHIFFSVEIGDVAGPYRDLQPHLYWLDAGSGQIERWAKDFTGAVNHYAVEGDHVLVAGRLGTEVSAYSADVPSKPLSRLSSWSGTYENLSTAEHSSRIAFIYSALERPTEVYLAESADRLQEARAITRFNQLFLERDLPQGKPYRWKVDDGTTVEGMLMYPPGKFEARNLPTFVLIHGGPADADGNHFEADWYQWDRLAATAGWLVFEPNYRGSTGYGDKFLTGIVPQIVSRPGKDILEGMDALVKEGRADPNQLAIGGYSYGGYMTNWLITQTTRFKAAVSGAGAVEHVANWGNDDTTFDDAYFLGGRPWEASERYHDEAAIYYINRVKTPTHLVAGANDIRVAVAEDYLLDHALHNLGVPSTLLVFPGEGHSLSKNPWHGKIKVREELKWLEKYGGMPSP
jgi:dipeptidyl aminopeptidase/acylaminoacyl peptidase